MRQLFAVAMMVAVMGAPACAQRGGGGRGGFGGHAGSGFGSRGGFSGASAGHFEGRAFAPGYGSGYASRLASGYAPRYGVGVRAGSGAPAAWLARPGVSGARPSFYSRGGERRRKGFGYRAPYGYAYYAPDYGWLDANDLGYGDDYDYDDGGYGYGPYDQGPGVDAESYGEQAPENYVEQPAGYGPAGYGPGGVQYAEPALEVEPPYAERAQRLVARTPAVAPSLFDSDAVTLVFKDGRPPQTIHNYALTRTTLYVTDGRPREIPVAALDLAATEKANRAAGVSFRLPVAQ